MHKRRAGTPLLAHAFIAAATIAAGGCAPLEPSSTASSATAASTAAASTAAAPPPAAGVTSSGPASGQWQLVLEVDDARAGAKLPPQTMTMCSTPEDKEQWQDMIGGKTAAGCTVKNYSASGPTISYTMQCGGGIEGRTTIRVVDADHYAGESTLTLTGGAQPATIRSKVTARRIAPTCGK